ncbi:hypothetical protein PTKIN_Ptkin05aG0166800 [Pterospermum kingtungense]
MASLGDRWSRRWGSHIAELFHPPSSWTQDAEGNDLLHIFLPGFKPEEVRIELASAGLLKIEGERIVNENKCIYIDHTFPLPENYDIENIVGKFEGERLQITVPKIVTEEENKQQDSEIIGNGKGNDSSTAEEISQQQDEEDGNKKGKSNEMCRVASFGEETIKKWEEKDNPLKITIKYLKRNKGIVVSVVISFSIGVWVSKHWIRSGKQ